VVVHVLSIGTEHALPDAFGRDVMLDRYHDVVRVEFCELLARDGALDRAAARDAGEPREYAERESRDPGPRRGYGGRAECCPPGHHTTPARMRSCRCTIPMSRRSPSTTGSAMIPCFSIR